MLRPDVLEEDDGVLVALAPRQHLPEEGRAHAQHDLVRLEHAPPARQRHVRQDLQKEGHRCQSRLLLSLQDNLQGQLACSAANFRNYLSLSNISEA